MYKKIISLVLLVPMLALANDNNDNKEFNLTIIHTNDVHAHLLPINKNNDSCSPKDDSEGKCFGGVARRMAAINEIRRNNSNLLILDAGDQLQGTMFYLKYKGDEAQRFLNELGFHATTLGNHEFDDGSANLARYIKGLKFPVISSNVDTSNEPLLADMVKPYTIINIDDQKIGITGCTTTESANLSNPGSNIKFNDIETSVAKTVTTMRQEGVNKVILLCHQGYEEDKKLARKINGIDIIVGGHSHTYLSNNSLYKNIDRSAGRYPTVVRAPNGNPVLIVQAYAYGKYLGKLDVTFNHNGVPIKWSGNPILLDAKIKPDPKVVAEVEAMSAPLHKMLQESIGQSMVDLNANCRIGECNFGNLLTDAMLSASAAKKTEISILNGGTIRLGIARGDISLGSISAALPFNNTLVSFGLKGRDLRTALENAFSKGFWGAGRFPQVAGLRIKWKPILPPGHRIMRIEVKQKGRYLPLDPDAVYQIAATSFLLAGGDGYNILAQKAIDPYNYDMTLATVLTNYIKQNSPVNAELENRIIIAR